MAEWVATLIPWLTVPGVAILVSIGWILYYFTAYGDWPLKKEWWQDREKRLEKERKIKAVKRKTKLKKG